MAPSKRAKRRVQYAWNDSPDEPSTSDNESDADYEVEESHATAAKRARTDEVAVADASPHGSSEEIDTEPEFDDGYDAEGFADEADRAHLLSLNAVERETILAERFERRQKEYEAWQFRKALRERRRAEREAKRRQRRGVRVEEPEKRSQQRSRKQALDALARSKRQARKGASGRRQADYADDQVAEEDYVLTSEEEEADAAWRETYASASSGAEGEDDDDDDEWRSSGRRARVPGKVSAAAAAGRLAGGPLSFSDLVDLQTGEPTALLLTRANIERLHQKPWFRRYALNCFVRVPSPATTSGAERTYVLARVVDLPRAPRLYPVPSALSTPQKPLPPFQVGFRLVAELCGRQRRFTVDQVSRGMPTADEWAHLEQRHREQRLRLPSREQVHDWLEEKRAFMRGEIRATERELEEFRREFERLHPEAINYARRITEVRDQLEQVRERLRSRTGDDEREEIEEELAATEAELARLEALETAHAPSATRKSQRDDVREAIARKNATAAPPKSAAPLSNPTRTQAAAAVVSSSNAGTSSATTPLAVATAARETDPFARRTTRGGSYFFQTPTHDTDAPTDAAPHSPPGGATGEPPDAQHGLESLRALLEPWLWHGPLLQPLRSLHVHADEDVFQKSRDLYLQQQQQQRT
ncbi:hypothetical protein CDCA_CDCA13G3552 [Cyanidium caldarium]|uniref:Plus3 domain-containing protein n=1 Tax=Cyanidium caldarium TaxID=2771 RepID=A0AAV9IYW6_CYACA|nr:hypothetical protein CDCA_CDCA13G3552 [Cyanidium caldarium]